ncbi:histidine kinase [Sphingomonas montana]|uniref:histidine kinase n=1 Tax=Sphingomonas montana TaxID=1843236 RepID=UPI00096E82D6|nr:histidine kinase [Sphingomonas montana]
MGRFLMGAAAAMLLMTGVMFWWKGAGRAADAIPPAPTAQVVTAAGEDAPITVPPAASVRTREEKRFGRYDKDKNGAVARSEYLASRQKAFAKLDVDRDGRLSFDEYSVKAIAKFAGADADRTGALTPAEFATTRVVRKAAARAKCPPVVAVAERDQDS